MGDRTTTLWGLSRTGARRLRDDLLRFVNLHLAATVESSRARVDQAEAALRDTVRARDRYLAASDIDRFLADVPAAMLALSHPLFDPALHGEAFRARLPRSLMLLRDPEERRRHNDSLVRHELLASKAFFDDVGGVSLSEQQREACIRLEDSNLLVASAGSGKTATMVAKVAYLLGKGHLDASEILVLAFNRKAADELRERIARQLGVDACDLRCRVATFHGLGRSIIEEVEGRPPQLANWVEAPAGEARFIEGIVRDLTEASAEFRGLWTDLLTLYPKADIPPAAFDDPGDYERHVADDGARRGGVAGTLAGVYVKSIQEQRIVNWLWMNSVEFEYERQAQVRDEDGSVRHLHPDFYYPSTRTVHEHFAVDADGTSPFPDYARHTGLKRAAFARSGADFFETTSADATAGRLLVRLEAELERRGIPTARRPREEVLKAVAPVVFTRYHKIVGICVKHIRANRLTPETLLERATSLHDAARGELFARAVALVAEAYASRLEQARRIDFDMMVADATRMVEDGRYRSPYSLILVDEFQDMSAPRADLIRAMRRSRACSKLFAVGDDWQSIYRFTGSDVALFTRFDAAFGPGWQGRLEDTYRCNQALADVAAGFVQRNPAQLRKSVRSTRPAVPRSVRAIPLRIDRRRPVYREACLRLLSRLDAFLEINPGQWRRDDGHRLEVLVLWRYNMLDPFHGRPPTFGNLRVSGLSFHRSKGLEADYTILLDVSEGDYGIPARIEDDELLDLVIPRPERFPYAEERRLFYVALTRASRGTFLLYDQRSPSRYIGELSDIAGADVRFETVDGAALRQCPTCVTGQLVERARPDGGGFLGCSAFPRCRHTQPLDQPLRHARAG